MPFLTTAFVGTTALGIATTAGIMAGKCAAELIVTNLAKYGAKKIIKTGTNIVKETVKAGKHLSEKADNMLPQATNEEPKPNEEIAPSYSLSSCGM